MVHMMVADKFEDVSTCEHHEEKGHEGVRLYPPAHIQGIDQHTKQVNEN